MAHEGEVLMEGDRLVPSERTKSKDQATIPSQNQEEPMVQDGMRWPGIHHLGSH